MVMQMDARLAPAEVKSCDCSLEIFTATRTSDEVRDCTVQLDAIWLRLSLCFDTKLRLSHADSLLTVAKTVSLLYRFGG